MTSFTQFKLSNGDEIIAKVIQEPEGEDINIVIKDAMMIVRSEEVDAGFRYYSLRPWMSFQLNTDYFQLLNYSHIVGEAKPDTQLLVQYEKAIQNETGSSREDDHDEIEMLKSLYRNYASKDEQDEDDAEEDNVVPLFDKDKLH
ncbi:hypothetical protein N9Z53_02320 [Mariniblastus sp.]|jgi:hypothetical protein|nr:hypothetical protein [Mariniblastus sp.]